MRFAITRGTCLWFVVDLERDSIVGTWGTRTGAEADATFRNRRFAMVGKAR